LLTPPHAHATTSVEFENASDNFDDASTVLDESGSLGSFLYATIARTKQMGNTTVTPVSSPESRECPSDDLEEAYIELNDDFIDEFHAMDILFLDTRFHPYPPGYKLARRSNFLGMSIFEVFT
jgi:hypothetical protein